jgi:hypothetical protein
MLRRKLLLFFLPLAAATMACTFACDLLQQAADLVQDLDPEIIDVPPLPPDQPVPDLPPDQPPPPPDQAEPTPPSSQAPIPAEIQEQMDQIEQEVVLLRGIQPTGPVDRGLLSDADLRQYVIDDFLDDYSEEEAADDVRTLALFGLIEPGYDLFGLYMELYSEQIAGFYDDEIKQMFVVQGAGFGGPERITYAHEYAHALQDQRYDLSEGLGFNDDACEADSERCAAVRALVEGDATLLEERWLVTYATDQDFQELLDFYEDFVSPIFDAAPAFLQDDFIFPYDSGYSFVEHFFLAGGWAAVDAVYENPPVSTEQILHPDRYPDDKPVRLEAPDLASALGEGWRELDQDVLGEWFTQLTLVELISTDQAETAAAGWGGDYYVALFHDDRDHGALVLLSSWDTVRDAQELYEAFRTYGGVRFGERIQSSTTLTAWENAVEWSSLEISSDQTLWILAPTSAVGEALRQSIVFPAAPAN